MNQVVKVFNGDSNHTLGVENDINKFLADHPDYQIQQMTSTGGVNAGSVLKYAVIVVFQKINKPKTTIG